jgi:alkylation response protein AidB-like acyl-CoA dehydrogenase
VFEPEPDDELALLAETVRSFAADAIAPRMREAEAARRVDPAVHTAFREIGLDRLEIPEEAGGAGLGARARALVNEALGAADPGAALALDPLGPALYPLLELGGTEELVRFAAPVLEAPAARAVLVTAAEAGLEVRADGMTGRIPWVPADRVDLLVVLDAEEALVVRAAEGVALAPLPGAGLRAAGASELRLAGAPVAARLRGAPGAARALARARLAVAGLLVGVLEGAAGFARAYALEREAFGRPIAHHQALAFLLVDLHAAVDGARLLLHEAAWQVDAGLATAAATAAAAFAEAVEAARLVGPSAVQVLGGHGFMQDYPVEKAMREARALGSLLGGLDAAREDAGRALCAAGAPVALSHGEPR